MYHRISILSNFLAVLLAVHGSQAQVPAKGDSLGGCRRGIDVRGYAARPVVVLQTELVKMTSRPADVDLDALDLRLKLRFTSCRMETLLLYKSNLDIRHVWVSKDVERMSNGDFEVSFSQTAGPEYQRTPSELKLDHFARITPDDPYEIELDLVLVVRRDVNAKIPGSLTPGEHVLRIQTNRLLWDPNEAKAVVRRFSDSATVITDSLSSAPMRITIPMQR